MRYTIGRSLATSLKRDPEYKYMPAKFAVISHFVIAQRNDCEL